MHSSWRGAAYRGRESGIAAEMQSKEDTLSSGLCIWKRAHLYLPLVFKIVDVCIDQKPDRGVLKYPFP
jgi:hypothetical protein